MPKFTSDVAGSEVVQVMTAVVAVISVASTLLIFGGMVSLGGSGAVGVTVTGFSV